MNDLARKVKAYLDCHRHHDGMNVVLTLTDCDELVAMVDEPPAFIECGECFGSGSWLGSGGKFECPYCKGKGYMPLILKDLQEEADE